MGDVYNEIKKELDKRYKKNKKNQASVRESELTSVVRTRIQEELFKSDEQKHRDLYELELNNKIDLDNIEKTKRTIETIEKELAETEAAIVGYEKLFERANPLENLFSRLGWIKKITEVDASEENTPEE
ncbi:MAG: hypothetical protein IJM37_10315 [Lachnospiraceae bacterium]|nr:hypothetical protein [Lachnospiraceae bacterium]